MNIRSGGALFDEFQAGVTACLRSWSALRTAVQSGWGGVESIHKAEYLRAYIYNAMIGLPPNHNYNENNDFHKKKQHQPLLSCEDLQDHLSIYMEEEFSVVLEDQSDVQVARILFQLYEDCFVRNDVRLVRQLIEAADSTAASGLNLSHPTVFAPNDNDSSSSSDEEHSDKDDMLIDTDTTHQVTKASRSRSSSSSHMLESHSPVTHPTMQESASVVSTLPIVFSDYASQPLFGPLSLVQKRPVVARPIRQLGEAPVPNSSLLGNSNSSSTGTMTEPMLDKDGFVPVTKAKKKNSRFPLQG